MKIRCLVCDGWHHVGSGPYWRCHSPENPKYMEAVLKNHADGSHETSKHRHCTLYCFEVGDLFEIDDPDYKALRSHMCWAVNTIAANTVVTNKEETIMEIYAKTHDVMGELDELPEMARFMSNTESMRFFVWPERPDMGEYASACFAQAVINADGWFQYVGDDFFFGLQGLQIEYVEPEYNQAPAADQGWVRYADEAAALLTYWESSDSGYINNRLLVTILVIGGLMGFISTMDFWPMLFTLVVLSPVVFTVGYIVRQIIKELS